MPSEGVPSILIMNCGQLLTLRGPRRPRRGKEMSAVGLIRHGALLIRDGRIEAVGPEKELRRLPAAREARPLDARGSAVLPGFVDSHTHALFAGSRVGEYVARLHGASYAQLARAGGGIRASARHLRAATDDALAAHLTKISQLFLEHGTTTAEVKSGYGLELDQEMRMLRVIQAAGAQRLLDLVPTLLLHDVPARFVTQRARYLDRVIRELIPQAAREGLAEFCDVFCDRGYFSVGEARRLLMAAADAGLKLKLHAAQLAPSGAARMAASLGAVSVDHLEYLTEADIRALRKSETIGTLLPGSVLHLGATRYPPARRLIDAGVSVALATNFNPGSSPSMNMQLMLSLACSQMRMTPEEVITAATINGAYAVGRGHCAGSLEPGKLGDLVVMDVPDYREIPYYFGVNHCTIVVKRGRVVFSKASAPYP